MYRVQEVTTPEGTVLMNYFFPVRMDGVLSSLPLGGWLALVKLGLVLPG